jgi:hypothetical protein
MAEHAHAVGPERHAAGSRCGTGCGTESQRRAGTGQARDDTREQSGPIPTPLSSDRPHDPSSLRRRNRA